MVNPDPPNFEGWEMWCAECNEYRAVPLQEHRDVGTGEKYYEAVCQECLHVLITLQPACPKKRGRVLSWPGKNQFG